MLAPNSVYWVVATRLLRLSRFEHEIDLEPRTKWSCSSRYRGQSRTKSPDMWANPDNARDRANNQVWPG